MKCTLGTEERVCRSFLCTVFQMSWWDTQELSENCNAFCDTVFFGRCLATFTDFGRVGLRRGQY